MTMTMSTTQPAEKINENDAIKLEREWRRTQPKLTDRELVEIFPEEIKTTIVPEKIKELEEERRVLIETIKEELIFIKQRVDDELSQQFWRAYVKFFDGSELVKNEKHIAWLKRLLLLANGKTPKGWITEEKIQRAREVPIESLINQPLRKNGKALVVLCPLHEERHPSFFIYSESSRWRCYGCNQGGDVINFVQLLYGCSFKKAIQYLTGG